nr:immunoglobulin heavy chain junction region [Macaca mulatta]MOW75390.1 immunoglobulin heavy chain junction region [Macaca mulatta]MOW75490.1 immunoglobulin heavy chain junction region [Macaca mulatta]MOW75519.1 immunoglobulin heavy chain junction region [Macaca mulatta]MOW76800.1 immunoglobulin heavy chain junction region [Macaca mulatta]
CASLLNPSSDHW